MWIVPFEWVLVWFIVKMLFILMFLFSLQAWSPHLTWDLQVRCFVGLQPGAIIIGLWIFKIVRAVRRWRRRSA